VKAIEAAGGLLWRTSPGGPRLVLVHRPRHRDWSLPKGKLEADESFQDAALREVREETACEGRLRSIAGVSLYQVGLRPKVVLFWNMDLAAEYPFAPGEEIDAIAWLTRGEALARLDHESERRLLARLP